jgi:multidrug efflux pump subunit AcrA (membrane-fusion protein)
MRRIGRPRRARLIGVLGLSAALAACVRPSDDAPHETAAPVRVHVAEVRRGDISDILTVTGETAALSSLRLSSPVAGHISQLTARPGDRLDQGAVAARVISLENEAALHGFKVIAESTRLSAEEQRLAQRLQREISVRSIPLQIPFPAVVAERLKNPGEIVAQGDVILELFDSRSLFVLAQVPVESAGRVHVGLPVEVVIGDTVSAGEVGAVVTALVPQSLTVPVRITLSTPPQPPLLHAAARCRITLAHDPNALIIPRSAIVSLAGPQRGVVMVAVHQQAQRRTIQMGIRTPNLVEVRDGLAAGELVLTEGQYALPDGTPIELASPPPVPGTAE